MSEADGPIAAPYVDIRVPLDGLKAGLAQAETATAEAGLRMGKRMSAALVEGTQGLGEHMAFDLAPLTPAIDKVVGEEADGHGHGFRGMRYQMHAAGAAMTLMGLEGNRAVEGLGLALSHMSHGFDAWTLGIVGGISVLALLAGKQGEAAAEAKKQADETRKLNDELERMRAVTHDLLTMQRTAETLPFVQKANELQAAARKAGGLTSSELQGLGRVSGDDRLYLQDPNATKEQIAAVQAFNNALDQLKAKEDQLQAQTTKLVDSALRQAFATHEIAVAYEDLDKALIKNRQTYEENLRAHPDATTAQKKEWKDAKDVADDTAREVADRVKGLAVFKENVFLWDRRIDQLKEEHKITDDIEKARTAADAAHAKDVERWMALGNKADEADAKARAALRAQFTTVPGSNTPPPGVKAMGDPLRDYEALDKALADLSRAHQTDQLKIVQDEATKEIADTQAKYDDLLLRLRNSGRDTGELTQALADDRLRILHKAAQDETLLQDNFFAGFETGVEREIAAMDQLGKVGAGVAGDMKTGFENVFAAAKDGAPAMAKAFTSALDTIEQRLMKFVADQAFTAFFGKADANGNLTGGIASAIGQALGISLSGSSRVPALQNLDTMPVQTNAQNAAISGQKSAMLGDVHIHNYGEPVTAKAAKKPGPKGDDIHITLDKAMAGALARGGQFKTALESQYDLTTQPRHR